MSTKKDFKELTSQLSQRLQKSAQVKSRQDSTPQPSPFVSRQKSVFKANPQTFPQNQGPIENAQEQQDKNGQPLGPQQSPFSKTKRQLILTKQNQSIDRLLNNSKISPIKRLDSSSKRLENLASSRIEPPLQKENKVLSLFSPIKISIASPATFARKQISTSPHPGQIKNKLSSNRRSMLSPANLRSPHPKSQRSIHSRKSMANPVLPQIIEQPQRNKEIANSPVRNNQLSAKRAQILQSVSPLKARVPRVGTPMPNKLKSPEQANQQQAQTTDVQNNADATRDGAQQPNISKLNVILNTAVSRPLQPTPQRRSICQEKSHWKKLMEICPFCNQPVGGESVMLRCIHRAHPRCVQRVRNGYCQHCKIGKM